MIELPTQTIIRDDRFGIEAVIAKDVVVVDGKTYDVPGRGSLASWLLVRLQQGSLYATRLALASKEGIPVRSRLSSYADQIYERGYARTPMDSLDFGVRVEAFRSEGKSRIKSATLVDLNGVAFDPGITNGEHVQALDAARKLFTSFANRYAEIGLFLERGVVSLGKHAQGRIFIVDFPYLPETAHIVDAQGERYDYRLIAEGSPDLFLERYRAMGRKFGLTNPPVTGLG